MSVRNAQILLGDIDKALKACDQRSMFTLRGVSNLSRSDLDTLVLYAETFIDSGGIDFGGLMSPIGEIAEVLNKYGIEPLYDYLPFQYVG